MGQNCDQYEFVILIGAAGFLLGCWSFGSGIIFHELGWVVKGLLLMGAGGWLIGRTIEGGRW